MDPNRSDPPAFGPRVDGVAYIGRPGAYAVILDAERRIAVVEADGALYLPGGGIEAGETPEAALEREALEEIGRKVVVREGIGRADEYVYARREATYFRKEGRFFRAVLAGDDDGRVEPAPASAKCVSAEEAIARLAHGSHVWAVRRAVGT